MDSTTTDGNQSQTRFNGRADDPCFETLKGIYEGTKRLREEVAMSVRAECVMLNKGPHILKALNVLDDILTRMRKHQEKKRPLMRRLRVADSIGPNRELGRPSNGICVRKNIHVLE